MERKIGTVEKKTEVRVNERRGKTSESQNIPSVSLIAPQNFTKHCIVFIKSFNIQSSANTSFSLLIEMFEPFKNLQQLKIPQQ